MPLSSLLCHSEAYETMLLAKPESFFGLISGEKDFLVPHFPAFENTETCQITTHAQNFRCTECDQIAIRSLLPQDTFRYDFAQFAPTVMGSQETDHFKQNDDQKRARRSAYRTKVSVIPFVLEATEAQTTRCTSQQEILSYRASRAERRLQVLLGEHSVQHYKEQLKGLSKKLHEEANAPRTSVSSGDSSFNSPYLQEANHDLSARTKRQRSCQSVDLSTETASLTRRGWAALRDTQRELDSEATDSSSDEEWGADETRTTSDWEESECWWLSERARLASCWTWLQLRLSELNVQLQRLTELHHHLHSSKRGVVLAKMQPLTDKQIQQTLLTETTGLTLTAESMQELTSDLDSEPCSPARLLWNIERQSAQLSQIVNSLMAPLNTSPSSSPESKCNYNHCHGQQKTPFNSHDSLSEVFLPRSSACFEEAGQKRRHRSSQADVSCVSARTRPLLACHKRRLFTVDQPSLREQDLKLPVCSKSGKNTITRGHPVLLLSSAVSREDWLWRSPSLTTEVVPPSHGHTAADADSLLSCKQQFEAGSVVWNDGRPGSGQETPRETCRGAVKRRHRLQPHQEASLSRCSSHTSSPDYSTEDAVTPHCTHTQHRNPQFPVRRRNGDSVFNINNIFLPVSLSGSAKVEKPQYRDILTPSWRIVSVAPLVRQGNGDQEKMESVSDKVFSQRHRSYEHEERLRWGSWKKDKRSAQRTSCPDLSDRDPCSSVGSEVRLWCGWSSCSSPAAPAEGSQQQREVEAWRRRVFPLCEEEEDALRCGTHDDDDDDRSSVVRERPWR